MMMFLISSQFDSGLEIALEIIIEFYFISIYEMHCNSLIELGGRAGHEFLKIFICYGVKG